MSHHNDIIAWYTDQSWMKSVLCPYIRVALRQQLDRGMCNCKEREGFRHAEEVRVNEGGSEELGSQQRVDASLGSGVKDVTTSEFVGGNVVQSQTEFSRVAKGKEG